MRFRTLSDEKPQTCITEKFQTRDKGDADAHYECSPFGRRSSYRLWFGEERPFQAARDALRHVETELERWDTELEAERSALARSILGIVPGDIVTSESRGKLLRLSVTGVTLYSGGSSVSFMVSGIRFRKDGTLGKLQETLNLSFTDDRHAQK
jgi:hypothetical protein